MRSVIVTVSGPSRSGKDTLIGHVLHYITAAYLKPDRVEIVSSIDVVKGFTADLSRRVNDPENAIPIEPTHEQRQMWADIKAAVDRGMQWTARYPFAVLGADPASKVLIYQVREIDNVQHIRELALAAGVAHIAVFVHRPRKQGERPPPAASTDIYPMEHVVPNFDVIVNNSELQALPSWGEFIALHTVAAFNS